MPTPTSRVLVADSDRLQLQLIDMLLSGGGFETTLVETGREALEHLKERAPDLCLLALDLPDIPGDDICGKIRRVTRLARTPVVLIAPQAGRFGLSEDARSRARRAGADLILPRPLGDKNLRDRLQAVLDERDSIPEREGMSTLLIEETLMELDKASSQAASSGAASEAAPETSSGGTSGSEPPAPAPRHGPFALSSNPPPSPARDPADDSTRDSASDSTERTAAGGNSGNSGSAGRGAAGSAAAPDSVAIRREIDTLRIENAQLKRKLQAKVDELQRSSAPELERQVAELERRNAALLEALEKAKGKGDDRGGFFRRRT